MKFDYEVWRGTEGPLATARTSHASVNGDGRVGRLPTDVRKLLS